MEHLLQSSSPRRAMPFALPAWISPIAALALLVVSGLPLDPAFGQDAGSGVGPRETRKFDPIDFREKPEFDVSDLAQVPVQVAQAAEQSGCNYKEDIGYDSLRFVSVGQRRFVVVPCAGTIIGTHQVFDLSDLRRPQLMTFSFLAHDAGFGVTPRPGVIIWRRDAGVLEASTGSDICHTPALRHIYRLGITGGLVSRERGFALVRVDVTENGCADGPWSTVWEAPKWPTSTVVR
jgi:hypothetical protein